jgi:hypothetical protein
MVCFFFIVKVKSKVLDIYEGSFSNTVNYYATNVALLILNETGLKKMKTNCRMCHEYYEMRQMKMLAK